MWVTQVGRIASAAMFWCVAVSISPVAAQQRTLLGRVVDSATRAPLAGAVLERGGSDSRVSNNEGRFLFSPLPASRVSISVRALGYAPVTLAVDLSHADAELLIALAPRTVLLDTISASARSNNLSTTLSQSATVLGSEDLAKLRGQTLGESLREIPGVSVIQYGPGIAKPVVRGMHSQRVAVINGVVPQEGQQWGAEHAPEIDVYAANEVEVIRGASGILYGSSAIGGVVRVLPRPLPTSGGLRGELQSNYFSNNNQGAGSLTLEGSQLRLPLLPALSWRLQGTLRRAGDARTSTHYLPNTSYSEADGSAAIGYRRDGFNSELTFSHYGTNLGMYSGAHIGNLEDLERAMADPILSDTASRAIRRPDQTISHNTVTWRNSIGLSQDRHLDITYGYQYNNRNEYDSRGFAANSPRPAFGLRLITHTLDLRMPHSLGKDLTGTVGLTGLRQGNLSTGRSFLIPQYRLYTGGLYTVEEWTPSRWSFGVGLRYDYRWQHAYQFGAPVVISPDDVSRDTGISMSLSANYAFAPGWSLGGTTGRMWRAPNVNERFSQGVHHGTAQYEMGDPTLGQERTIPLETSLRFLGDRTRFELSAYRNRIDGYIQLQPREPVQTVRGAYPAYQYAATDAWVQGAEITAQFDPSRSISLYGSGSLVRGTDRKTDTPLFDMPADRLTATVRYTANQSLGLYGELTPTLVRRQDQVPDATIYRLPTSGYSLLDLAVGVDQLQLFGKSLNLGLTVRNLFNTSYRDYLSRYRLYVDDTGRDLVFRLSTTLGPIQ